MTDGAQQREVFQEAAQREPQERSACLDEACGGDAALRLAMARPLMEASPA